MKKQNLIFLIIFLIFFFNNANGNIKIKYKIGNEIVTNIDIINEKNYLIFLRPNLIALSDDEINKIAINSLIKEIIKKKELEKIFKNSSNINFTDDIKKNLFRYKKVNTEEQFKKLIKKNNLNYENILEKIKFEGMWNELIFLRYNSMIKINEKELKKKLIKKISNEKKYEYNLSEILFEIDKGESLEEKFKNISNYIKINDFKSAASKYSISNSANRGGEIGWVKETLLSNELINILGKMETLDISLPIKYPNGFLILKINEKKLMKQIRNLDKELEELILYEKNRQLNQFSLLLFKKLKSNVIIDEY